MCSCESRFSLQVKEVVCLTVKDIKKCFHQFYLEYISVRIHNSMNDDRDPPSKISRNTTLGIKDLGKQQLQNSRAC